VLSFRPSSRVLRFSFADLAWHWSCFVFTSPPGVLGLYRYRRLKADARFSHQHHRVSDVHSLDGVLFGHGALAAEEQEGMESSGITAGEKLR
jgi:hypothetical protein